MGRMYCGRAMSVFMVLIFIMSVYSPIIPNHSESEFLEEINSSQPTSVSENIVSIGSYPSSTVSNASIIVPSGKAVTSLDLTIEGHSLPNHVAYSIDTDNSFQSSNSQDNISIDQDRFQLLALPETQLASWTLPSAGGFGSAPHYQTFNYQHTFGTFHLEYNCPNYCYPSETSLEYKIPSSSSFVTWKRFGDLPTSPSIYTLSSNTETPPLTFNTPGNYTFRMGDDYGDGSNGGQLNLVLAEFSTPEGSWQSEPISLSSLGIDEAMAFGPMSIDAKIPSGSKVTMSIIDPVTNMSIPGFEGIEQTYFDLGIIDWELYPEIAVNLELTASSTGESPIIYGLHFEGKIVNSLETDVSSDWNLQSCTWSSGQISGSGGAISPKYHSRSGFSIIKSDSVISGGKIQYSLDNGQIWNDLDTQNTAKLSKPYHSVHFKASGANNWVLEQLSVDLLRTSVAEGVEIDLRSDSIPEWSINYDGAGKLGVQNRFVDNSLSMQKSSTSSNPAKFGTYLPSTGIDSFEFYLANPSGTFSSPYVVVDVGGQNVFSRSIPDLNNIQKIELTPTEITQLNGALTQSSSTINVIGNPITIVEISVGSSATSGMVDILGLHAIYSSLLNIAFDTDSQFVKMLNIQISEATLAQQSLEIELPIRMKGTGSLVFSVNSVSFGNTITPGTITVSNISDTFTPSMNWIDVTSTFDFSTFGISNPYDYARANSWLVDFNLIGKENSAQLRCSTLELPINGPGVNSCIKSGVELIWSDLGTNGAVMMSNSAALLEITHRFKFPVEWDDEEFLVISTNLVSSSGPMLPVSKSFGLGNSLGVENDISVKNWEVVGLNGIGSDINYPYLKKGEPVTVKVHLGFEGVEGTSPRTGHALIRLLVEGNEYASSSIINDGVASIQWVVPSVGEDVNLEIDVLPLKNQDVSYEVPRQIDFGYDSVSPQLLYMNVDEFDHFESSPSKVIEFTITDRPVLPSQAEINIWRSWIDDFNMDGEIDLGEFSTKELHMPDNLMTLEGVYDYSLDTSSAPDGGYVRGWITVADSAGNVLPNSGNLTNPLFNLLISSDGSPQLGYSELSWEFGTLPWLHPGENISLLIPVWDKNGITDITEMELDLSINQPDSSTIFWNRQTDICSSSTLYIEIMTCSMVGDTGTGLFTNSGQFSVTFQLKWGFDPDDSVIRTPNLVLSDLKGQSTVIQLTELNWRYSGEMTVDQSSMEYSITGNNESSSGAWVMAREEIGISGTLEWIKTGRTVNQELQLMYNLGLNIANVEYSSGMFNGTIITPASSGNYALDISLLNAPNGASITAPTSPLLWFIVDDEAPSIVNIDSPSLADEIKEDQWSDLKLEFTLSENLFLDEESVYLSWEVHRSGFGFSSSSIANGTDLIQILGGQPFGDMINAQMSIDLDSVIPVEIRTEALELRIWIFGSDMAGNNFGSVSDEIFSPFAVWQLEQQLPEYVLTQPSIGTNSDVNVGTPLDLSVVIQNVGQSDGFAQLRVERVESNGARTIIHTQEVKVQSGGSGFFNHRWTPDRDGSMWIEFIIVGGPTSQTETFYANDGESDGFFGGIAEINPILLIVIFLLIASLIGLIVFGLRTPNANNNQRLPPNKNYQKATGQIPVPQQNSHYAQQQVVTSPGDNPYQ